MLQRHRAMFIAPGEYVVETAVNDRTTCRQKVTVKSNETTTVRCGEEIVRRKSKTTPDFTASEESRTASRVPLVNVQASRNQ